MKNEESTMKLGTPRTLGLAFAAVALLSLSALAADPAPAPAASTYNVDAVHSSVGFKVRHLVGKVPGSFKEYTGTIVGDPKDPQNASITLTIKAASITTANEGRDKHLNSPDFFDTAKYPEITFKSSKITPKDGDQYEVAGTFTMHGVTKEIVVPVFFGGVAKDPWGNERAGFSVDMTLNRKDYGINFNKVLDQGGTMLGDDVTISIEIEAVKKSADKPAEKK
jgi:polyisoprenoid-binding protein YceI